MLLRSFPDSYLFSISHRFPLHLSPPSLPYRILLPSHFSQFVSSLHNRRNFVFRICEELSEWVVNGGHEDG